MSDPNATQPLYDGSTPYVSNTAAPFALLNIKPDYTMTFGNDKGVVGKLDFNGPVMVFTGDVDESAKLFVDAVEKWFLGRIEKAYEDGFVAGMKKSQESKVTQLIEAQLNKLTKWAGLTDAEIWQWVKENTALTEESGIRIVRAIETKLKEKNGG